MHADHLAAHDILGDLACAVVGISGAGPPNHVFGDKFVFQFPGEKAFSRVARPERAIAVKRGNRRFEVEHTFDKFRLNRCKLRHVLRALDISGTLQVELL